MPLDDARPDRGRRGSEGAARRLTVLLTLTLTQINSAILQAGLPYDPVKDFEPLSPLATGGPMLIAKAGAPFSSLAEFVDHARTHQGLCYGTRDNGSTAHRYGELPNRPAGLAPVHVPYKGKSAAHSALFGDLLAVSWASPASAKRLAEAGKIKVRGIAASKCIRSMPDVPTFGEQGFAGFDVDSWNRCLCARAHAAVLGRAMGRRFARDHRAARGAQRLVSFGFEPLGSSSRELPGRLPAHRGELIRSAGGAACALRGGQFPDRELSAGGGAAAAPAPFPAQAASFSAPRGCSGSRRSPASTARRSCFPAHRCPRCS